MAVTMALQPSQFFQLHVKNVLDGPAMYGEPVRSIVLKLVPNIRCSRVGREIAIPILAVDPVGAGFHETQT